MQATTHINPLELAQMTTIVVEIFSARPSNPNSILSFWRTPWKAYQVALISEVPNLLLANFRQDVGILHKATRSGACRLALYSVERIVE